MYNVIGPDHEPHCSRVRGGLNPWFLDRRRSHVCTQPMVAVSPEIGLGLDLSLQRRIRSSCLTHKSVKTPSNP